MNVKYEELAKILQDRNPDFLRDDSDQNVDQLIVKPNLYYYVFREDIDRVEKEGIMTPAKMLETYPDHADKIKKIYGNQLADNTLANSVCAFFCRVPTILPNTKEFNKEKAGIKIVIDKLKKSSDDDFKVFLINHPFRATEIIPLNPDSLNDYTKKESTWFGHFKNSQDHKRFRDVPQAAIYCPKGIIPAFAIKVLRDSNKELV